MSKAAADTITFGGGITQSTQNFTGPAANNPSLNNMGDGDNYAVTLDFSGSITAPGTYNLTGGTLTFGDAAAGASESSFGLIQLTILANGSFDDVSLLGCLTTGSNCFVGNQLDANFRIAAADLNAASAAALGLDEPHPLDLLEDDGITDIHGSIDSYSYRGVSAVPEPSMIVVLAGALALLAVRRALKGGGIHE